MQAQEQQLRSMARRIVVIRHQGDDGVGGAPRGPLGPDPDAAKRVSPITTDQFLDLTSWADDGCKEAVAPAWTPPPPVEDATDVGTDGQFTDDILQAKKGEIAAKEFDSIEAARTFEEALQATNAARASRLGGARAERHIGAAQCEPTNLRLDRQTRGLAPRRRDARVLVLYAGAGGATSGISACKGFQVVAAVEKDSVLADLYRANHGHTVLELDLMNHAHAAHVLRQHGPFDMVQLSPPCVDFSVSGRCIEGRAAWLTVTAALLILDLGVPCSASRMWSEWPRRRRGTSRERCSSTQDTCSSRWWLTPPIAA